jgi:hypothetical protein
MVPRSVSLTIATAVIITMVIERMMASSPGTMLVEVLPSGLYSRCTTMENGAEPACCARGPVNVSAIATVTMPDKAATAPPVAEGSEASAATRISGLLPRTTSRSKSSGITTTKFASPRRSASSPSPIPDTAPLNAK